jgi:hypothetical protein
MFMPKQKFVKLLKTTKIYLSNTINQNSQRPNIITNNINKKFSILNNNKSKIINQNSSKYKIINESCFTLKFLKRNFCILEKIKEQDNISKEEFTKFVTNFQNGEINLSDFPLKYKKFIKEIKLLPKEPEEPDDCCGKDCVPCNIEFYHEKLDRREEMIDDLFKRLYPDNNKEEASEVAKSNA